MLPVYFMLIGNSISNRHVHVLQNGMIISHAHPFEKSTQNEKGTSGHSHSKTELILFQSFDGTDHLLAKIVAVPTPFISLIEQKRWDAILSFNSEIISLKKGRAPPVYFI